MSYGHAPTAPPGNVDSGGTTKWTDTALRPRVVISVLGVLLVVTVVLFGALLLGLLLIPRAREAFVPVIATALVLHALVMLAVIHLGLRRAGSGWRALGWTMPSKRIFHLFWQIPAVLSALVVSQGIAFSLMKSPTESQDTIDSLFSGSNPGVLFALCVGMVFLTPLWEESVFRGLIHGSFRRRFTPFFASVISGGVFAACHGIPALLPYMLVLGVSLAYLREFHRTLWAPFCLHIVLNGLVASVTLVSVAG